MKKIVLGILAHVDAGKTTLSESLLYTSGTIKKVGRVDNKDAFLDTDSYEKKRGITIFSKTARFSYGDTEFTLVDTPGHVDFSSEMERALSVLDYAVLCINGSDGVQAHTKTVWKLLQNQKVPTFIFVNKMDLPDTDKDKLLANIKENLTKEAVSFDTETVEEFYENVATASEELLESYMETGQVSEEEIAKEIEATNIFPVFFGSALKLIGIEKLLNGLDKYTKADKPSDEFSGVCYKISKDKNGNRLTFVKVNGGSLVNKGLINGEKINEIRLYSGDKYEAVSKAEQGEICALLGPCEIKAGTVIGKEKTKLSNLCRPVLTYSVKSLDADTITLHKYLLEIEEEEPNLFVEYSEATKDVYVHLFGEVQTEIIKNIMEDRFKVNISFGEGKILYKETILDTVEGVGHFEPLRHYAEVHLKMEPGEPGTGNEYYSEVSTDDLAINWQRLILTHLKEKMHKGVLTGAPVTDIKFTLVAGKAHLKHTEGGDFRQATYRAVRQGLMQATSQLLEPFYFYELTVPSESVGRAMTDIDQMAGTVNVTNQTDGMATLSGIAPVATLNGYSKDVYAYTKGLGSLSVSVYGYAPCHNTQEVLERMNYNPEADIHNTPDSVFCSHGAGTVIPWYEVPMYMHLPFSLYEPDEEEAAELKEYAVAAHKDIFVSTEEIDDIINKASFANKNGRKGSYKGIPASLRERIKRNVEASDKPYVYKPVVAKEKFMLIDGYNVVHAWKELSELAQTSMDGAAGRLIDIVGNYQGAVGFNVILVFDAYRLKGHREEVVNYGNVKVVYTKTAETADHYIERYAHENGKKFDITVVTSDGVEQIIIMGAGCKLMSSREFEKEVEAKNGEIMSKYLSQ